MRILRGLFVGLLALLALLMGGLALAAWLVDVEGLIETYKPVALEAASKALDREVEIGAVSPTWFPTLGVRAEAVAIGDAPLHPRPGAPTPAPGAFVRADALEVGIAVWPALVSLGRDIAITEVRLEKPRVRVVRYPDGSFNFSDIGTSTVTAPEPPPPAEGPSFVDRLRSARVEGVVITEGEVAFEDQTPDGLGTIAVRRVGLDTEPVGLGLPIRAELSAALKGREASDVRIELDTGPLADAVADLGVPEPKSVKVHADALPLSLVPVEIASVALGDATLAADVEARAEDGADLTVSGPLEVRGLRLRQAGSAPGAEFDVRLGLSVRTSTAFDRFRLDGTELAAGPLATRLAGEARIAPTVTWRKIELDTTEPVPVRDILALLPGPRIPVPDGRLALDLDTDGDPDALEAVVAARWLELDYVDAGMTARGAAELRVEARGAPATPTVNLVLDLGRVAVKGEGYAKPAGLPTKLDARIEVAPERIRVARARVDVGEAELSGGGVVPLGAKGQVDLGLELAPLALRPFLDGLAIPAASLPEGSELGLRVRYQASAASPAAGSVTVPELAFRAGKSRLTASATVDRLDPLSVRVDGRSPYLDLDELLPASPERTGGAPPAETESPPKPDEDAPILPPSMKAARVVADLQVKTLRYLQVDMSDVDVRLVLEDGVLQVKKTQVGVFGGRFVADGSRVDLGAAPLRYDLSARLAGLRGESVLQRVFAVGEALTGQLDSEVTLAGRGTSLAAAAESLTGAFSLALSDGRFDGVDLVAATVLPLRDALEFASKTTDLGLGKKLETEFRRLAGQFEVVEGQLRTKGPMTVDTPRGEMTLDGGMGLDGGLRFQGTYAVPPALLTRLTGGKVRASKPLPVSFGLGCTLLEPCVKDVDVQPAAEALARLYAGKAVGAAARALEKKTGVDAKKAKEALEDVEATKRKAEEQAKRKAAEAKRKAEAAAKRRAEEAKKKLEEEAKKKLKGLFGN